MPRKLVKGQKKDYNTNKFVFNLLTFAP